MRSLSKSIGRCALSISCLGIIALAGCGNKPDDAAKPASGEYYKGAMDKKPDQTPGASGRMKAAAPGTQ